MKAEPAAGVWGRRIAKVSDPAATHPGWLLIEKWRNSAARRASRR